MDGHSLHVFTAFTVLKIISGQMINKSAHFFKNLWLIMLMINTIYCDVIGLCNISAILYDNR